MDMRSQRGADDLLRTAVDQLMDDDPITAVRQLEAFIADALPYLRSARRAAIYRAKTKDGGMPWTKLATLLTRKEDVIRRTIARHCADTGDPWPAKAGTNLPRPTHVKDLRQIPRV